MNNLEIDTGDVRQSLHILSQLAARLTGAAVVLISKVDDIDCAIVGRFGCDIRGYPATFCTPVAKGRTLIKISIRNPGSNKAWRQHPVVQLFPSAKNLTAVPFKLDPPNRFGSIILIDPDPVAAARTNVAAALADVARMARLKILQLEERARALKDSVEQGHKLLTTLMDELANSQDAAVVLNRRREVVAANAQCLRWINVEEKELQGRQLEVVSPIVPEIVGDAVQRAMHGQPTVNRLVRNQMGKAYNVHCMPLQTSEERSLFILVVQRRTSLDQRVARWAQTKSQSMTPAPGMEEANAVGDATAKFLLETLVRKQTIHHRNQASYVSLRTWRRPIKAYQIEALDALKAHSPHALAKTVALEVAESVRGIFGAEGLRNVVPVPCGSSRKSDCLSVLIAQDLARLLGIRFCNILVPGITKAGKSHPKKSAQLQPYTLSGRISGPTLVVDDVSTSGRHMELAFEALRKAGTPVVGTTWIGS